MTRAIWADRARRKGRWMRVHRRLRGDGGAAAVEFALLLPFLALLVCGVIDLGRWFSAWNETKNAAREGAREIGRASCRERV